MQTVGGLVSGAVGARLARADELPWNTDPRAISGDSVEPDWEQRVTLTVGQEKADLVGTTDRVIQAAVDYVARRGGGTVRVLPVGLSASPARKRYQYQRSGSRLSTST